MGSLGVGKSVFLESLNTFGYELLRRLRLRNVMYLKNKGLTRASGQNGEYSEPRCVIKKREFKY